MLLKRQRATAETVNQPKKLGRGIPNHVPSTSQDQAPRVTMTGSTARSNATIMADARATLAQTRRVREEAAK